MSKSKTESTAIASTFNSIAEQITSASLTPVERRLLRARNENVPDELVEMVTHLAEQGNGSVLGIPFDAAQARATLAQTSSARTTISVGQQTLQRMEDEMIQQRATVADPAFAIYTALRRLVKTKTGNALSPAYEKMKTIVKNRPRRTRKKTDEAAKVAPTPATETAPTPTSQAPALKAGATTST